MQKFLALTTLVAAAHAAELLATADIDATVEQAPENGIDGMDDTALNMGAGRDYYKKGHYENDPDFEHSLDAEIRPLCSIEGAEGLADTQGPSDQCCRTYDYIGFNGNHRDWCLFAEYNPATWSQTEEKQYDLDQLGWHNDISSWKCGNLVQIEMCKHSKDNLSDWDPVWKTDDNCHSGHQLNNDMGSDSDVMDQLWIKPQNSNQPEEVCTATLYENDGCMGPSFVIESDVHHKGQAFDTLTHDQQWKGSWMHYDVDHHKLLKAGTVKSVMFKGIDGGNRCVVEMFQAGNFKSDSMTLKSLPNEGESCHPVPFIAPIVDTANHGRWAGNDLAEYTDLDKSGVHAVQIRQEYFPLSSPVNP